MAVSLRGELVVFLHAADAPGAGESHNGKKAVLRVEDGRSWGGLGMLDAGTRKHLDLLLVG